MSIGTALTLRQAAPRQGEFWYPTAFSLWGEAETEAIARVLNSGRFTQGPEVAAFEHEFAAFHRRKHAIMVNSGSSANLIAVAALTQKGRIKRGQRAVVPALAWSTTYAPLVQHGLDLVLVDCDGTWNADCEVNIPAADDISLVVGCSVLGNPASLDTWSDIADVLGATFIEDNCESCGAACDGQLTGTFGVMSTFSLFHSHQISAIEGGVIVTDGDYLADTCRMLRAHGWTRDVESPASFDREYDFRLMGFNVRGLELHAAIARAQLKKLPAMVRARRANLDYFRRRVTEAGLPIELPDVAGEPSPFGLAFAVADKGTRAALALRLRAMGIDCRLPTGGSLRKHVYGAPWADQATPCADYVHDCGLFLGNGPFPLTEHIEKAVEVMRGVL